VADLVKLEPNVPVIWRTMVKRNL